MNHGTTIADLEKLVAKVDHGRHPLDQCGYEVACYGDERLICGAPVIEGTPRCQQHQGLDIKPWEDRADFQRGLGI